MIFRALTFLMAFIVFMPSAALSDDLTLDRIFGSPSLDGESLKGLKVSPDGNRVTYLKGKEGNARQLDLWEYNVALQEHRLLVDSNELLGGEEILSEEEKSRRERQRILDSGIVSYFWDSAGKALLFPLGGDVYYKPVDGPAKRLTETEAFETDIKVSPEGRYVSFIRDQDIFIIEIETGKETQLTFDGEGVISNGVAEFVAQEEMERYTGYWWAPDDSKIAFTHTDESPVQIADRYEIAADGSVTVFHQRYPKAGTPNALIELGVVDVSSGNVSWIDLGDEKDIYLARVNWLPDSETVAFQRESRDQKILDLVLASADGSAQKLIIREQSETWINLSDNLAFFESADKFLWTSERSGYRHIYLYSIDGTLERQITNGDWVVTDIKGYDENAGMVYFEAFADTPLELHLYAASTSGGDIRRVTHESAWHGTVVETEGNIFVDNFSSDTAPPKTLLKSLDGAVVATLTDNEIDENHPYFSYYADHTKREFGTTTTADGTVLHYSLMKPAGFDPEKKYPAIVYLYGGPSVTQKVRNDWAIGFNQFLARNGFVVFTIDNRGTENRGKAFEDPIYRAMAGVEVEDQALGAKLLKEMPFVDAERVGIFGWSYGGYMALNMMMKKPGLFKAGFSGAPVTDWRLYDTHYTERYMGNPYGEDAEAYETSSIFPYVGNLQGKLLVIHGMADDNVLFDHTVRLIADFQKRGIPFEFMAYPGERHGIYGREQGIHRWKTAFDFFERNLKD